MNSELRSLLQTLLHPQSLSMAQMTQNEYARHRKERGFKGTTHKAVQRALETKRIAYEPGTTLIDPEKADKAWAANTEMRSPRMDRPNENVDKFQENRANREFYEAELARLKVEERLGKLIPASIVQKALFEASRVIFTGLDDIVAQLSPQLIGLKTIAEAETFLRKRLNELKNELAKHIESIDEKLIEPEDDEE